MRFDHWYWLARFMEYYKAGGFYNNSVAALHRVNERPCFRVIGIHHLTPAENGGKRNVFFEVVNPAGQRLNRQIEWGWQGQRDDERPNPVKLDKPLNEPAGNISIDWGQRIWARVLGHPSDKVENLTTQLPDEGPGNTIGHHSYFVVFMLVEDAPPPVEPEPPVEPGDCAELERNYQKLLVTLEAVKDLLKGV